MASPTRSKTPKCRWCRGFPTYMSPRCTAGRCAHVQGRVLETKYATTTNKHGTTVDKHVVTKRGKPVMTCPVRTCVCRPERS